MALNTVADEVARIANDVRLATELLGTKPSLAATGVLARAQALKYAHDVARKVQGYEQNTAIRAQFLTQISDLEKAYRAAGGTGITAIPSSDTIVSPIPESVSRGVEMIIAIGGLATVGYLLGRKV